MVGVSAPSLKVAGYSSRPVCTWCNLTDSHPVMPTRILYIADTMKQGPFIDYGESRLRSVLKIAGGLLSGGGLLGGPSLYMCMVVKEQTCKKCYTTSPIASTPLGSRARWSLSRLESSLKFRGGGGFCH